MQQTLNQKGTPFPVMRHVLSVISGLRTCRKHIPDTYLCASGGAEGALQAAQGAEEVRVAQEIGAAWRE